MASRLAYNPIVLQAGDITVRLKPCLRAGALMAQSYSVEELLDKIGQCHFGLISYLIAIGCDDIDKAERLVELKTAVDGLNRLEDFYPELFEFIAISLGLTVDDESDEPKHDTSAKPISRTEYLAQLFEFGTGWLGWTPADTWAATPAEIAHARDGHYDMLLRTGVWQSNREQGTQAYTPAQLKQVEELGYDPAFDRGALDALRHKFGEGV